MSFSSNLNRQCIHIKADQNMNEIRFRQNLIIQRQQQSSSIIKTKNAPKSLSGSKNLHSKQPHLKEQIYFYLASAITTKQNINKGLQFVKTIQNFNQDQRCLEHNNVITLYCMNDHKLLCVYCIYGVHKHRAHKLLPVWEHLQSITKDVMDLQIKYNNYLLGLDDVIGESKQSTQMFQNLMKRTLSQIEIEYMRRKLQIEQLYQKQKTIVIKTYEQIIEKTYQISNEYEQIKFNIWEYQARYNLDKKMKISTLLVPSNDQLKSQDKAQEGKKTQRAQQKSPKKRSASMSKKNIRNQKQSANRKQKTTKKQILKEIDMQNINQSDRTKDFREIIAKHVVLSHIVEEMTKIQPLKLQQKNIDKRVLNRANFKLIKNKQSISPKSNAFKTSNS